MNIGFINGLLYLIEMYSLYGEITGIYGNTIEITFRQELNNIYEIPFRDIFSADVLKYLRRIL